MSARGKTGHLDKVHGQGLPPLENNPFLSINRPLILEKRPLEKEDIEELIVNINDIGNRKHFRSITGRRKAFLEMEYLCRELEIRFDCTLKQALQKFPELGCE